MYRWLLLFTDGYADDYVPPFVLNSFGVVVIASDVDDASAKASKVIDCESLVFRSAQRLSKVALEDTCRSEKV